ncbi:hypothetical protein J6590_054132 [Homalodisca vitripennis]|nr:hypothetical protein J6590_054132 [Homalodisca vitripennis]
MIAQYCCGSAESRRKVKQFSFHHGVEWCRVIHNNGISAADFNLVLFLPECIEYRGTGNGEENISQPGSYALLFLQKNSEPRRNRGLRPPWRGAARPPLDYLSTTRTEVPTETGTVLIVPNGKCTTRL